MVCVILFYLSRNSKNSCLCEVVHSELDSQLFRNMQLQEQNIDNVTNVCF